MNVCNCLIAALCLLAGIAVAADSSFTQNEMIAKSNLQTREGAAYDRSLGLALQARPEFEPNMTRCLEAHPGKQAVHGYFHFASSVTYRVVLQPRSQFSDCLANALEGFSVPPPPSVPYFNSFTFSVAPGEESR